jgi:hypothetical protein
MDPSDDRLKKQRILAELASRLRAFYEFLLDDSVERGFDLFDRAMQQNNTEAPGENVPQS